MSRLLVLAIDCPPIQCTPFHSIHSVFHSFFHSFIFCLVMVALMVALMVAVMVAVMVALMAKTSILLPTELPSLTKLRTSY